MKISETQVDINGYKQHDRVYIKVLDKQAIVILAKLVLDDKVWIACWKDKFSQYDYKIDASYMKSWEVDERYTDFYCKDVYLGNIIGRVDKRPCKRCNRRRIAYTLYANIVGGKK